MLNFFRGDRTYEDSGGGASSDLFRLRDSILGDIINAQPAYVKKSPFAYADAGYAAFQAATNSRRGTVYAAANDGYLHAFETDVNNNPYFQTAGIGTDITSDDTFQGNNTGNGVERWAYVPGIVLPNAYRLANKPYSHRYLTDGSPQVGDICVTDCGLRRRAGRRPRATGARSWSAGLNSGGMGYYALDVTDPLPSGVKVLWEFTNRGICYTDSEIAVGDKTSDCHLGLSYGNPIIAKRKSDGKWVVIVTSGYNNTAGGGDGKGYLYILEAAHRQDPATASRPGSAPRPSPSGLAKINGWATSSNIDNTVLAVYGGDLEGNLWRFQLDSTAPGYLGVVKVAAVTSAGGVPQPITVKPELGPVPNQPSDRMILFGTGKFLENTDKTDTSDQTIYALKDVPTMVTSPVITGGVRGNAADQGAPVRRLFNRRPDAHRLVRHRTELGDRFRLAARPAGRPRARERRPAAAARHAGHRFERALQRYLHGRRFLVAQLPRLCHRLLRARGYRQHGERQARQLARGGYQRHHAARRQGRHHRDHGRQPAADAEHAGAQLEPSPAGAFRGAS